jgi:predicted nucleic acid-binding protein
VIHFDTTFVVDFLRETARSAPGPASRFLDSLDDAEASISVFVECELFAGVALAQRAEEERKRVADFCSAVRMSYPDARFAEIYGRIAAALTRTCMRPRSVVVTRFGAEFRRGGPISSPRGAVTLRAGPWRALLLLVKTRHLLHSRHTGRAGGGQLGFSG